MCLRQVRLVEPFLVITFVNLYKAGKSQFHMRLLLLLKFGIFGINNSFNFPPSHRQHPHPLLQSGAGLYYAAIPLQNCCTSRCEGNPLVQSPGGGGDHTHSTVTDALSYTVLHLCYICRVWSELWIPSLLPLRLWPDGRQIPRLQNLYISLHFTTLDPGPPTAPSSKNHS